MKKLLVLLAVCGFLALLIGTFLISQEAGTGALPPDGAATEKPLFRHTIRDGETLTDIAERYAVPVAAIIAANELENPDLLLAGQQLIIPGVEADPEVQPMGPPQAPAQLGGLPLNEIVVIPPEYGGRLASIYLAGSLDGRNPRAYSKLGDSTIENPHFMAPFGGDLYDLGPYAYLQPTVDYYAGSHQRQGAAVQRGLNSYGLFSPIWADPEFCEEGEGPLECELRLHQPSVVLVYLGSNDLEDPAGFEANLGRAVEILIEAGVIPILGTKAASGAEMRALNEIVRRTAQEYQLPLWDFARLAETLPNHGLREDGIHLTYFVPPDLSAPEGLESGYGLLNLSALMALESLRRLFEGP